MAFMRVVFPRATHAHEGATRIPMQAGVKDICRRGYASRQISPLPVLQQDRRRLLIPHLAFHADAQARTAARAESDIENRILTLEDGPAPRLT